MNELRKAREMVGLSAYALAQKAGTLEGRIFAFERQRFRPKSEEARRIAEALGTSVEDIFPEFKLKYKGGEL